MRQVGSLSSEVDARRLAAYLVQQNIDAIVEHGSDQWIIWVRNEDQRNDARASFQHFVANPQDARYQQAEKSVEFERHETVRPKTAPQPAKISWRRPFGDPSNRPDVVVAIMVISTVVTLISWLPGGSIGETLTRVLKFADIPQMALAKAQDPFFSIRQGELWRFITPIFIHLTWEHIIFNMVMFYYLGVQIERLRGPIALGLLMLLLAIISNTAQAYFGTPNFGGISGVVYGFLGYIWIKNSYDPDSGFVLEPMVLALALGWLVVCMFWKKDIANYAHLGGLIAGIVIGSARGRRDDGSPAESSPVESSPDNLSGR